MEGDWVWSVVSNADLEWHFPSFFQEGVVSWIQSCGVAYFQLVLAPIGRPFVSTATKATAVEVAEPPASQDIQGEKSREEREQADPVSYRRQILSLEQKGDLPKSEKEPRKSGASWSLPGSYKSESGSKCHPDTATVPLAALKGCLWKACWVSRKPLANGCIPITAGLENPERWCLTHTGWFGSCKGLICSGSY